MSVADSLLVVITCGNRILLAEGRFDGVDRSRFSIILGAIIGAISG